jgi:hypothetical protein
MRLLRTFFFLVGLLSVIAGNCAADDGEALLRAARDGNEELALKLARAGGDVHLRGPLGETALHWAAFNGSHELVRLLIERGADVNAHVRNGNTPLHQAAYRGHLQVVALLVASGATVDVINQNGFTSAEWARRNNHEGVYQYLLAHGAQAGLAAPQVFRHKRVESAAAQRRFVPSGAPEPFTEEARAAQLPGLSTRLGDLPPLVLKVPDEPGSEAPALRIENSLDRQPATQRPAQLSDGLRSPTDERRSVALLQLGAFSTPLRAQTQWRNTVERHADLVKQREPSIVAVQLADGRTVHRLRVGPLPVAEAHRLCAALVARKASCLVIARTGEAIVR